MMSKIVRILRAVIFSSILKVKYGSRIKLYGLIKPRGKGNIKIKISPGAKLIINGHMSISEQSQLFVRENAYCEIGKGTFLNRHCSIVCRESIIIGERVLFGESVKIYDNDHKIINSVISSSQYNTAPIVIGDKSWIANDVNILKGSIIPNNSVIGAMSLVNKPLHKPGVYAGIPSRLIKAL